MQDPRVRFACAFLLSLAAFICLAGAVATFLWWLLFTPRLKSIRHIRAVAATLLLFVLIAAAMALTGTDGFSYLARMSAILLVGTWVYADSRPGDFLATGTWLFGPRMGFELGMIAEMAMGMAQGSIRGFFPDTACDDAERAALGDVQNPARQAGFLSAMRSGGRKRPPKSLP